VQTTTTDRRKNDMIESCVRAMQALRLRPPCAWFRGYCTYAEACENPFGHVWLREVEVIKVIAWLEEQCRDRSLANALPMDSRYDAVRQAVGSAFLKKSYCRTSAADPDNVVRRDNRVRDRLISALIATGRLRRYSLLETWPVNGIRDSAGSPRYARSD
jgi:hypothetical protein